MQPLDTYVTINSFVIYVYNSHLQANNIFSFTAAAAIPNAKIAMQWEEIGKIVLTSILMGAIVVFVKQSVHVTGLLQLFFLVFVGMVSYGIMLLIFRVEIANELLNKIKARIRVNTDE